MEWPVRPTCELVLTAAPEHLQRQIGSDSGLNPYSHLAYFAEVTAARLALPYAGQSHVL